MADRPDEDRIEPEDPALSVAARHALHDEELIAAFATDGDEADDAERAKGLVDRCAACRELHEDLLTIGGALRAVGAVGAIGQTERAPRDFRLTPADAARLRPDSPVLRPVVRLRDRIAAALRSIGRPMGMSMAAVGVVGLLFGVFAMPGAAALAPVPEDVGTTSGGVTAASSGPGAAGPSGPPAGGPGATVQPVSGETRDPAELTDPEGSPDASRLSFTTASPVPAPPGVGDLGTPAPEPAFLVMGGSVALLAAGIGLFALGSRRREPDRTP